MSKTSPAKKVRPRILAVLLLIAAVVMLFLAYQSLSTDQYKLYSRNHDYYLSEAAECRAKQDTALGAHYAYLAAEWEDTAQMAGSYLTQHRAGAASLGVVSLVCIALGIKLLIPAKKKEE